MGKKGGVTAKAPIAPATELEVALSVVMQRVSGHKDVLALFQVLPTQGCPHLHPSQRP